MVLRKTTVCSQCGKTVPLVLKQAPDMPNGVKNAVPGSHICNGKRVKH